MAAAPSVALSGHWNESTAGMQLTQDLAYERSRAEDDAGDLAHWTTSVIEVENKPVGRLRVMRAHSRIELCGIQLHPDAQGLGIGTAIIRDLQSEAAAEQIPLDVSVNRCNTGARRLYERLGCHKIGESRREDHLRWVP